MLDNYLVSYGACEEVTGSMHLINLDLGQVGKERKQVKILLDCGLFQGDGGSRKNLILPKSLDPKEIDYIFLTHGHIDHVGRLPILVKRGFYGKIICTPVTRDIAIVVLEDSLKIQDEEEEKGEHFVRLFDAEDIKKVKDSFECNLEYPEWNGEGGRIKIRFIPSEHIIGSASILIEKPIRLLYTGDLGGGKSSMHDIPVPKIDGETIDIDYLIMESTYGNRKTGGIDNAESQLKKAIEDIRIRKGKLLIASMAVDRTEEILRLLKNIDVTEKVYLDSVMGASLLRIYLHNKFLLSKIAHEFDISVINNGNDEKENEKENEKIEDELKKIFRPKNFEVITTRRRSKEVADSTDSCIIIASSGMLEGGRIMGHLPGILEGDKNILLFTGYQPSGTLGREILDGGKGYEVILRHNKKAPHWERNLIMESDLVDTTVNGEKGNGEGTVQRLKIKCDVRKIDGLSAHADQTVLLEYINEFNTLPVKIFLVHGEKDALEDLGENIKNRFKTRVIRVKFNEEYKLDDRVTVEKVVTRDISNVDKLKNLGILKFADYGGIIMAPYAGFIIDKGGKYELIGQEDVQNLLEKTIPTKGINVDDKVINLKEDVDREEVDKAVDIRDDEFIGKLKKLYDDGYISKGLVKGLMTAIERGKAEYRSYINKRINGDDLLLDKKELQKKDISNEMRDESTKELGNFLIRPILMDMDNRKILSLLEAVLNEIK